MSRSLLLRGMAVALVWLLASCGGGGGSGVGFLPPPVPGDPPAQPVDPTPVPEPVPAPSLSVDCSGEHCGAASPDRYAGSGVGVWRYINSGTMPVNVPVSIQGVESREVTVIYANPTPAHVPMPVLHLEPDPPAPPTLARKAAPPPVQRDRYADRMAQDERLLARRPPRKADPARAFRRAAVPARSAQVGAAREWFVRETEDRFSTRLVTLRKTVTAARGRVVNLWVEDSEYGEGKITQEAVERMAQSFGQGDYQIYAMATYVAGEPWGEHPFENLIGAQQPLDIVFFNVDRNGQAGGLAGRFSPLNNYLRDPDDELLKYSNESLAFEMDTEYLYLLGDFGLQSQISTLTHELTHMINFYQRGIRMAEEDGRMPYRFDVVVGETVAMMMQDLTDYNVDPGFHSLYQESMPLWLGRGLGNCSYTLWDADIHAPCFGYQQAASFGGYLLRQYGVAFFNGLLFNRSSTDSLAVLDDAIRRAGGPGFAEAWRRWGTMAALLPHDASPKGFGMPALSEHGFWAWPIPGSDFALDRRWPAPAPSAMAPYAQFPLRRTPVGDHYQELLTVPPGIALTVVVQ